MTLASGATICRDLAGRLRSRTARSTVVVRPEHAQAGQSRHGPTCRARSRTSSISAPTRISMCGSTAASRSSCASRTRAAASCGFDSRRPGRHRDRRRRRADPEGLSMASAAEVAEKAEREDIRSRWLLSAPALLIIFFAAIGPLLIVLVYSFLAPGRYGDVKWQFSTEAWISASSSSATSSTTRCRFADAHLSIFWRSVKLSLADHPADPDRSASRPPISSPRGRSSRRDIWLFLITIPFWTNLLIRTFAMHGDHPQRRHDQHAAAAARHHRRSRSRCMYTDFADHARHGLCLSCR